MDVMIPEMTLDEILILFVIIHIMAGVSQFVYYPVVKRYADSQIFPDKSYYVTIIVPTKSSTLTLADHFRSLCQQEYPNYEIIFVSENEDDPGALIAREVISEMNGNVQCRAKQIRYICAGPLEHTKMIAKSHNLIAAVEKADGEVLLFTDSDVHHPNQWIREMVNPLGENIRGKKVSASTAVFFIDPEGFLGIFSSLSSNAAAFMASFNQKSQDLPVYASGASMAVFREAFDDAGVIDEWKRSLNDDLVLASTLYEAGYRIFNVRRLPTRPTEKFDTLKGMNSKMVRWMLTVNHYMHPKFNRDLFFHGMRNIQFQVFVDIVLLILLFSYFGDLTYNGWVLASLLVVTYTYAVLSRIVIARIIQEKNVYPYIWLTPISQFFWGFYYIVAMIFLKRFTWGGREYVLNKRFGKLIR